MIMHFENLYHDMSGCGYLLVLHFITHYSREQDDTWSYFFLISIMKTMQLHWATCPRELLTLGSRNCYSICFIKVKILSNTVYQEMTKMKIKQDEALKFLHTQFCKEASNQKETVIAQLQDKVFFLFFLPTNYSKLQ